MVLRQDGFATLDEQANALGLSKSATAKIMRGEPQGSDLEAKLIARILAHKKLPPAVRAVLREYIIEKAQGATDTACFTGDASLLTFGICRSLRIF